MSTPCAIGSASRSRTPSILLEEFGNTGNNTACFSNQAPQEQTQTLPKWIIQERRGWRRAVQNFTPAWFAVTMGTGIVSILFHSFSTLYPSHQAALHILSLAFFLLNILIFSVILLITALRYFLYPATWDLMLRHPVQSLFLGTLPMGFSTIVNMFCLVYVPKWGGASVQIAWAMWWVDVVVSVACCFGLPFQMMTKHQNRHETMTAAWLLPIVAPIVAAASGAVVASVLPNPQHALWTIITSYVLWGMGIPLACVVIVIYFHRLAVHKLPPQEVIVSVFLPIGPLGQGAYGIMALGNMSLKVFPETQALHQAAGEMLFVFGFIVALILWGFGLVWLFFALASISRSKFPFNMGWWGFTFPTGVFAMATLTLGQELPSAFFRILGTAFGTSVILLWLLVAIGTVSNIYHGSLFEAPCLRDVERACAMATGKERQAV